MQRRLLLKKLILSLGGICLPSGLLQAKTYLTLEQAQKSLCKGLTLESTTVTLTEAQARAIQSSSKVRVRNKELKAWKTGDGGWFILDQIIGKHEFIDIAVSLTADGKVRGIEVLEYRETYGYEVTNPKWLAQFIGRGSGKRLEISKDIQHISGATLSSVHLTEGVNRLLETWAQVLRYQ
jgi:Na+-translocating ferredoxin:NAD+ oxidoreductase RnfG subunit